MYTFSFEKLTVWKESVQLVVRIYEITKHFPEVERFGLINQLRRASVSISSNITEGTSRVTSKDQAKFTTISYSSLMEVLNQLIISKELRFLSEDVYLEVRGQIEKLARLLNALRKSQLKS